MTQISTRPFSEANNIYAKVQLTAEQLVKAYRSMCAFKEHKEFAIGQIDGFVHPYGSTHRGHGHSIKEGAES